MCAYCVPEITLRFNEDCLLSLSRLEQTKHKQLVNPRELEYITKEK